MVARVLATRPTSGDNRFSASHLSDVSAVTAAILALAAPRAARPMLQSLDKRFAESESDSNSYARHEWLKGWLLVDPQHAEEIFVRLGKSESSAVRQGRCL